MGHVSSEKYTSFLEKLVRFTHEEPYNKENYVALIHEICNDYNLAKGVTEFYTTPMMEQRGIGESLCDFDNGKGTRILLRLRIITSAKAVIIGTIYVDANGDEYDDTDIAQLDLMFRIILGFVSRMRLIRKVEEFGFYDMDGYRNYRAFARFLDVRNTENKLGGMIAFHYDMHNFGIINREIGRANSDIVMHQYYNLLNRTIGEDGIIARLGGDKFIGIFKPELKDKIVKIFLGTNIGYGDESGNKVRVAVGAGLYELPNPFMMKVYGDIMDKIMMASGIAKKKPNGGVVVYDDSMQAEKERVKRIQSEFTNAIQNEEFAVYYQPKVDVNTGRLVGAEALARWIKEGRIVPPMEFIPILELNSLISKLDFYMLDHVCADIRRWLDEGKDVVRVSVNFSRKNLIDADLVKGIINVIDSHNVPHEYVEIELTETTEDIHFNDLRCVVNSLREKGVFVTVDDFGVGYSSINLIREVPWDVLKVDKGFVPEKMDDDNTANKLFAHVVGIVHDIGIECVIEGVETKEQLEIIKKNNCRIVQGYYFDKPLPKTDFEERLYKKVYNI